MFLPASLTPLYFLASSLLIKVPTQRALYFLASSLLMKVPTQRADAHTDGRTDGRAKIDSNTYQYLVPRTWYKARGNRYWNIRTWYQIQYWVQDTYCNTKKQKS